MCIYVEYKYILQMEFEKEKTANLCVEPKTLYFDLFNFNLIYI